MFKRRPAMFKRLTSSIFVLSLFILWPTLIYAQVEEQLEKTSILEEIRKELEARKKGLSSEDKADIKAVVDDADIYFQSQDTRFVGDQRTFEALLDNLDLSSAIWRACEYDPRYTVASTGGNGFYLNDPSGIFGDIKVIYRNEGKRIYFADVCVDVTQKAIGRILVLGKAVVVLTYKIYSGGDRSEVGTGMYIFVRVDDKTLGRSASVLFPFLRERLVNRIQHTLKHAAIIVGEVYSNPQRVYEEVSAGRESPLAAEYRQLFLISNKSQNPSPVR